MLAFTSIKRSPPMTEAEARSISQETHLFGYEPKVIQLGQDWFIQIRGDGSDDETVSNRLFQLRKPKWGTQS
jgi:hypothetical protein